MILTWEKDSAKIAAHIMQSRAFLKIVIKTKDDPILLPKWIEHHAAIVGKENLIIADNMSSDEQVQAIYESLGDDVTIFTFAAFHNQLHNREKFADLFKALCNSCRYYMFIDTDEMLYWIDKDGWCDGEAILSRFQEIEQFVAMPTFLVQNARFQERMFVLPSHGYLLEYMRWGKPIISSMAQLGVRHDLDERIKRLTSPGIYIHNCQFPKQIFDNAVMPRMICLHLTHFSIEQRLRANKNKLVARNFASVSDDYETISIRSTAKCNDPVVVRCVAEMLDLIKNKSLPFDNKLPEGCCELAQNGQVVFYGPGEEAAYKIFLDNGNAITRHVLGLEQVD